MDRYTHGYGHRASLSETTLQCRKVYASIQCKTHISVIIEFVNHPCSLCAREQRNRSFE